MSTNTNYRALTDNEIQTMVAQGCCCDDWFKVEVAHKFDPSRVRNTAFAGSVKIGSLEGDVERDGVKKPAEIYSAYLIDTTIGDSVRIADVGRHIAGYDIGDGVCIENVGTIQASEDAAFGNGVEIEPLNEGGGREVILFDRLDSQFADLLCVHRHRPVLTEKLIEIANAEAAKVRGHRGKIGAGATVVDVQRVVNVNIGPAAVVEGAAELVDGTVLSSEEAPTLVGVGVQAEEFIIAEGSKVTGGAIVAKSFVGQGCQVGKQFSSEGSIFFANCEAFHGEGCSIFAGPYTVSHHKSTLLIAGLFSFYNAGSGTNQSNHLYKLGPVHEGKLERGCKTGSFSYMMWPCRVGPFSVVLGKHKGTFDTADFPFSYIEADEHGKALMTPGFNFTTVGTVRDGAKWPARDRRKGSVLRDRITFDVLSPLTVGRMITGSARLAKLQAETPKTVDSVTVGGARVKRVLLRTGQKFYRGAIHMYLLEKVVARAEAAVAVGNSPVDAMAASSDAVFSEQWIDVGGQMMPHDRLIALCEAIESGAIADLDAMNAALDEILAAYAEDEWAWVRWAVGQVFEIDLDKATAADLAKMADDLLAARGKFLNLVLNDATKEFGDAVRTGFGQGGTAEDADADFTAVRGEYDTNKFVRQIKEELAALAERIETFKKAVC